MIVIVARRSRRQLTRAVAMPALLIITSYTETSLGIFLFSGMGTFDKFVGAFKGDNQS